MALYESGENYLETILILSQNNKIVKSIDVANTLGFSKASVSRAMSLLFQEGYIYDDYRKNIMLTEKGQNQAAAILSRHKTITDFLIKTLGINRDIAEKDACRIEHIISDETFVKMQEIIAK